MTKTQEIVKEAKSLEMYGCRVGRQSYDFTDTKPRRLCDTVTLPSIGDRIEVRLPCSNPHYLETVRIDRPVEEAIMFARRGHEDCVPSEGDIPTSTGTISTFCPDGHHGSWLEEFPEGDYNIPVRVEFNMAKARRRLEDRLRKMNPEQLFRAAKAVYQEVDNR